MCESEQKSFDIHKQAVVAHELAFMLMHCENIEK